VTLAAFAMSDFLRLMSIALTAQPAMDNMMGRELGKEKKEE